MFEQEVQIQHIPYLLYIYIYMGSSVNGVLILLKERVFSV